MSDETATPPPEPEEPLLTRDQARAKICQITINALRIAGQEFLTGLSPDDTSNATENLRAVAAAAGELIASLKQQQRGFERSPVILMPGRGRIQ